jgi:hypothetical protein
MSHRYLLSIDGGGLRGIIPAVALVKLEQTIGKLSREIFSLVSVQRHTRSSVGFCSAPTGPPDTPATRRP